MFKTFLFAFAFVLIGASLLGVGLLLTGKNRLNRGCGKKVGDCQTSRCDLCDGKK